MNFMQYDTFADLRKRWQNQSAIKDKAAERERLMKIARRVQRKAAAAEAKFAEMHGCSSVKYLEKWMDASGALEPVEGCECVHCVTRRKQLLTFSHIERRRDEHPLVKWARSILENKC